MELANELKQTGEELQRILSEFTQEQYNVVPFADSWTAGQVTHHIYKNASGMLEAIKGHVEQPGRAPDMHVKQIRDLFLNFDIKMKSPDFVLPSDGPHNRDELAATLQGIFAELEQIAAHDDLTLLCTDFSLPTLGQLTRLEFLNFVSVHTQRHNRQLRNILEAL